MNANLAPATPQRPSRAPRSAPPASPALRRAIVRGMAVCATLAAVGFGITVATGATAVFSILVAMIFTVLWLAFAAALLVRPRTLDAVWHEVRGLPLVLQGVAWFLFLPVMVGLWVWASAWPTALRAALVVGLGVWTVLILFPRG